MKINNKALQKLYQDYIKTRHHISRKNCPPSKEVFYLFSSKLSKKHKTEIINHITTCSDCFQEFEFVLKTLRFKLQLSKKNGDFSVSAEGINETRKNVNNIVTDLIRKQNLFFPKISMKYGLILLGVIVIAFITTLFLLKINPSRVPELIQQRGEITTQIKLIEPIGLNHPSGTLSFKWNKLKKSDYYTLELFDKDLSSIWRSEKIIKNHYILPQYIAERLSKNSTYFWTITSFSSNVKIAESPLEKFILKDE